MARSSRPIAILWDIENCAVPSRVKAEDVAVNVRKSFRSHPVTQGHVSVFSAYGDFSRFSRSLREGCQRTGINLIDIPNRGKDAADKAIMVDMLLFAFDNPPPCTIVLISGDVDFAPSLHKLGQLGFTFVLAVPASNGVSPALCNACEFVWSWPSLASGEGLVPANISGLRSVKNKCVVHSSAAAGSGKTPLGKHQNTLQHQENSVPPNMQAMSLNKDNSVGHYADNSSGIIDVENHRHGANEEQGKGIPVVNTQASVSNFAAMSLSKDHVGNPLSETQAMCTSQGKPAVNYAFTSSGKGFGDKQEHYTYAEVVMQGKEQATSKSNIQAMHKDEDKSAGHFAGSSSAKVHGEIQEQCTNADLTIQCKSLPAPVNTSFVFTSKGKPAGHCAATSKDKSVGYRKSNNPDGIHEKNQQHHTNHFCVNVNPERKDEGRHLQDMVSSLFNWPSKSNSSTHIRNGHSKKKSTNKQKSGTNVIYRNENNVVSSLKKVNCAVSPQTAIKKLDTKSDAQAIIDASPCEGFKKSKKKKRKNKSMPAAECEIVPQRNSGMNKKKKKDGVESSQIPVPNKNVKNAKNTKSPEKASVTLVGKKRKRNSPAEKNPLPVEHTKKKKKKKPKNKRQNNGA